MDSTAHHHIYLGRPPVDRLVPWRGLIDPLRHWAELTPDAILLSQPDPSDRVTYANALAAVEATAAGLRNRGIGHGSRIAVITSNSIDCVLLVLAVAAAGARCIMVNPAAPAERINEQVSAGHAHLVIVGEDVDPALHPGSLAVGEMVARPSNGAGGSRTEMGQIGLDEPIFHFYTTGSTAASKAVMQSSYAVLVNVSALAGHLRLAPRRSLIGVLPICFANGLQLSVLAPMVAGASCVLLRRFHPMTYLREVSTSGAAVASLVPSMLEAAIGVRSLPDLPDLEFFVTAAAPLDRRTALRTWELLGKQVVQGYGLSETTNFSTLMPVGISDDEYARLVLEAPVPPVGVTLPGSEVAVLDLDGQPVPRGETGEVCMRGHTVMLGYDDNAAETRAAFVDGWFHSGDLGRLDEPLGPGNPILTLTGRIKNIAKIGGVAISLEEIERIVVRVPGIEDVACHRFAHAQLGEAVRMEVACCPPGHVTDEELRAAVAARMALPRSALQIEHVTAIPRSDNGKIIREPSAQMVAHDPYPTP